MVFYLGCAIARCEYFIAGPYVVFAIFFVILLIFIIDPMIVRAFIFQIDLLSESFMLSTIAERPIHILKIKPSVGELS